MNPLTTLLRRWTAHRRASAPIGESVSAAGAGSVQIDPGRYDAATVGSSGPQSGTTTVQVGGVTVAMFDGYSAVPTERVSSKVTGIHAEKGGSASAGVATKNASAAAYAQTEAVQLTPVPAPMAPEEVRARLTSAQIRLADLCGLTPSLPRTDSALRLRLAQEFFFHLIGAVDVLAQIVNERLMLGIPIEDAGIRNVFKSVMRHHSSHPVIRPLSLVGQQTRNTRVPSDPYSKEGIAFRALISRHHVTHRHRNPFLFRLGGDEPAASLLIDIRLPAKGNASRLAACEELSQMLNVVTGACEEGLAALYLQP